jgi:xanthine dehydrogenase accessory factor
LKLVIAGAGHIGRSLSHLGSLLGFEVTVIDDRPEYANHENIPDAGNFIVKNIGEASRELKKAPDTYMVIVTRGHKDDAEALRACIDSDLAYLGMIGSSKKIGAVREEFFRNGWATPEQWSKLHSPIGLEINSVTVEEIAVSIAAQIIMVKNSRKKKKSGCPA